MALPKLGTVSETVPLQPFEAFLQQRTTINMVLIIRPWAKFFTGLAYYIYSSLLLFGGILTLWPLSL